jgi:hypothetical protein
VRDALDEAAEEAVSALYAPSESDRPAMVAKTRRTLRGLVNLTGDTINWGEWKQFVQRLELTKARLDMGQEAHGLELRRSSAGYDVRDDKGTSVFTLPRFTGQVIAADPKRYGPRLQLLSEALALKNPDALYDRAAALLHTIAEKEHDIADGTLAFGTAEARAGALVTWLKRRQSATTPEAQVEAENYIRAALFAEAAPGNRLASFGLDLAPIIANLRAAEDFTEDTKKAAKALNEGRYDDAAGASLWAVADFVGAVTGFGAAGKGLKTALRQSRIGRKAFAARDLARMARDFHRTRRPAPARALVSEKVWKMLDEDQRGYLEGLYSNVKGQAAEGALTDTLEDLGLNTAKVLERRSRSENPKIPVRRNSMLESEMLEEHGGRTRIFDDAIDGYGLEKSPFGLALFAKPIRGRQQKFEMKSADAELSAKQKAEDAKLRSNKEAYGDIDITYLALPYNQLSESDSKVPHI